MVRNAAASEKLCSMSIIHRTTLTPTKMELLSEWLPARPWYRGTAATAEPVKAGGFRLDDPKGKVGIEFMVATDLAAGDDEEKRPVTYHVPLTYRGAPLDGADDVLIGTCEHGVLGKRWVYDGVHDPVLVHQLVALIQGKATPQMQSENDAPDPAVRRHRATLAPLAPGGFTVEDGPEGTFLAIAGGLAGELSMHIARVLPDATLEDRDLGRGGDGYVTAPWSLQDGTQVRSLFVTATMD